MYNCATRHGRSHLGGPRIAAIGGGTGLSVLLKGLKKRTSNLSAIVTVTDDGGGSGVIRDELGILPPGDIRNCILALADDEDIMEQLLQYRFKEGRLTGQNMGNLFLAGLTEIMGDFEQAVYKLQDILRIEGKVIPVTSADAVLCALLQDGTEIRGESRIPLAVRQHDSPIHHVYLDPPGPDATPLAIRAIQTADMIVLGPGSLYSSIIPNLLVKGIPEAIQKASGIKVLMCSIMTQEGETDHFSVRQYAEEIEPYLGTDVIDYMLINNHRCSAEELKPYAEVGMTQMLATDEDRAVLERMHIEPIEHNMIDIGQELIRHDTDRVSSILMSLLHF